MPYHKPELIALGPAHAAIQGFLGKPDSHADSSCAFSVSPAYQADE
jgi:hypothetical protein